jgi:hypothetical protein
MPTPLAGRRYDRRDRHGLAGYSSREFVQREGTTFSVCLTPERGQVGMNVTKRCSYLKTGRDVAVNAYQL